MAILDPRRTLRTLTKNHALLRAVLGSASQEKLQSGRDGADGWSALFVLCHLLDYEVIFGRRAHAILTADAPRIEAMDNDALIVAHDYANCDSAAVLRELIERRNALVARLSALDDAAWQRTGVHPEFGAGTLLHFCANACMHDIDHIEQITRCLP